MSERLWYYLQGANQVGPVPESELKRLLQSGSAPRETMVWSDNLSGWAPAAMVQALWAPGVAAPAERMWHYLQGSAQTGPVPESELKRLLESAKIGRETMVWSDNMQGWAPANTVAALGSALPQAAAATPAGGAMLTPSEIVVLNPEQFAAEGTMLKGGNFNSITTGAKAGVQELTHALMMAALLANEQAGNVRLSIRPKKAMLGLKTVNSLWVEFVQANTLWPESTWEWFVLEGVRQQPREASDLFTAMLLIMSSYPWQLSAMVVCSSLANRGLLLSEEKKKFVIIKAVNFKPTPEVLQLMETHPWQPVKAMIDQCRQARPDIAAAIAEAVKTAVGNRTEYSE